MSFKFEYNGVSVSMNEDDGRFFFDGQHRSYGWLEVKRKIDNAQRTKYKPFKAVYYAGSTWLGDEPEIVTVTRPQIGSPDRVWISHDNKKRETVSAKYLYHQDRFDDICKLFSKMKKLN